MHLSSNGRTVFLSYLLHVSHSYCFHMYPHLADEDTTVEQSKSGKSGRLCFDEMPLLTSPPVLNTLHS